MEERKEVRVGVVGSGIAGLSCAYLLSRPREDGVRYHVTIIEKESILGMDAHSVNVTPTHRMDTPPRAFSPEFYPNLWSLYKHAGVPVERFDWAFSYSLHGADKSFFRIQPGVQKEFMGNVIPDFNSWNLTSLSIIFGALRFFRDMRSDVLNKGPAYLSKFVLSEYLSLKNYTNAYVDTALLPMLSMICTCSYEACLNYPMDVIADYLLRNTTRNQHRSKMGSQDVIKRLSQYVDEVILDASVQEIWGSDPSNNSSTKLVYFKDGSEHTRFFDKIVIASQANTALELLKNPTQEQRKALASFKYENSIVVVHRDPSLMPKRQEEWSPMNFIVSGNYNQGSMFTMWMKDFIPEDCRNPNECNDTGDVFQTWNPIQDVNPDLLIKRIVFSRPIVTKESVEGMKILKRSQGCNDLYFCGAYAMHAVPLQENGVASAVEVASFFGLECPWDNRNMNPFQTNKVETTSKLMHRFYDVAASNRSLLHELESCANWMCFGLWSEDTKNFEEACSNLALLLGKIADLNSSDSVLDVGFGCGDELALWVEKFQVSNITGIEPVESQLSIALGSVQRLKDLASIQLYQGVATELSFPAESFSKVVALDCAYHFDSREKFFRESHRVLKPQGRLALIDVLFNFTRIPIFGLILAFLFSFLFPIPVSNHCSKAEVKKQLQEIGYQNVRLEDISRKVIPGFFGFIRDRSQSSLFAYIRFLAVAAILNLLYQFDLVSVVSVSGDKC